MSDGYPGADGSPVNDGDCVYVVMKGVKLCDRMHQIDYFHGFIDGHHMAQMLDDESDFFAHDMISLTGRAALAITTLQRIWRAKRDVEIFC